MEEWINIKDNNSYSISSLGRVRNNKTGRILKNINHYSGYQHVRLQKKYYSVHRLVATHFIPNPFTKEDVNHINELKDDNRVENLEWTTTKENVNHGTRTERQIKTMSKTIYAIDKYGNKYWYESTKTFAKEHGCFATNVTQALLTLTSKGNKKTIKGFTFEYA